MHETFSFKLSTNNLNLLKVTLEYINNDICKEIMKCKNIVKHLQLNSVDSDPSNIITAKNKMIEELKGGLAPLYHIPLFGRILGIFFSNNSNTEATTSIEGLKQVLAVNKHSKSKTES